MRRFTFTIVYLMLSASIMAQGTPGGQRGRQEQGKDTHKPFSPEKYYKYMEEYISKEAELTDSEKAKFFPLFKEMLEAQRKIAEKDRELMRSYKTAKTESDYEKIIEQSTAYQVENKKIEQSYYKKFSKVLSWQKICNVRRAQNKFHMQALRRFAPKQEKHPQRQ